MNMSEEFSPSHDTQQANRLEKESATYICIGCTLCYVMENECNPLDVEHKGNIYNDVSIGIGIEIEL